MLNQKLSGLFAAACTPMNEDGSLNLDAVEPITSHLLDDGVAGLYVCGSTGEGMSLSTEEREATARAFVQAVDGRVPVIVQVGHNSLSEAARLAEHARSIGADIISATCPSYYDVNTVDGLVDSMAEIATAAPELPFFYYHIPHLTGSRISMAEFLVQGANRIPSLAGLKYTASTLDEFQECLELDGGRFDVVFGFDEMLLGGLAVGAKAAIGSTYNLAAPLYSRIIDAFEQGQFTEARRLQALSIRLIRALCRGPFHSSAKAVLTMQGLPAGPCRRPLQRLTAEQEQELRSELQAMDFFEWSQPVTATVAD